MDIGEGVVLGEWMGGVMAILVGIGMELWVYLD